MKFGPFGSQSAGFLSQSEIAAALAEDGWISSFAKVSRPLAVTMTVAIPALGAMSVGIVSIFSPDRGKALAVNSGAFLMMLPDGLLTMIGVIATGYIGFKSWETRSPAPPEGRPSPEAKLSPDPIPAPPAPDPAKSPPSMQESGIDARDYDRSTYDWAAFDEDAPPPTVTAPTPAPIATGKTWELQL